LNLSDLINGGFEATGGILLFNNCRRLYKDKQVKGITISSTVFFSLWGIWNLIFYPINNLIFSFIGGSIIVSANILWIILAWHYTYKKIKI
jgi:hypothetical protein